MPSDYVPVPMRAGSNVPAGPFSFAKPNLGITLTSAPFQPRQTVIGSPNNQARLDASQLGPKIFEQMRAEAAAKKAAEDAAKNPIERMKRMLGEIRWAEGGGGANRSGYTTSGPSHTGGMAGSFGSRSSSASRSSYGGGGLY